MGRPRTHLTISPSQRLELENRCRTTRDERGKERLRVVLKAAGGGHTLDELAASSGKARATVQNWLGKFSRGGIAGLLERDTPRGSTSPIANEQIQAEFQAGIETGRWQTAAEVAAWLKDTHDIKRSRKSIYYWLKKLPKSAPADGE